MGDIAYEGLDDDDLGDADPKCPLVLLLDTSESMGWNRTDLRGRPLRRGIDELNDGLVALSEGLLTDTLAPRRVEVQVVTFGGEVDQIGGFAAARSWHPPRLTASGLTPMAAAVRAGLELAHSRRLELQAAGTKVYRPWVFLLTDGKPSDDMTGVAAAIAEAQECRRALFWSIGTQDANLGVLRALEPTKPILRFDETNWRSLFTWISASLVRLSHSQPGDHVEGQPWAFVS